MTNYYITMKYIPDTLFNENIDYCIKDYSATKFYSNFIANAIWCQNQVHGKYLNFIRIKPNVNEETIDISEIFVYHKVHFEPHSM